MIQRLAREGKKNIFKFIIVAQAIIWMIHAVWKTYLLQIDMLQIFKTYFKQVILLIIPHPQATCFEE